MVRLRRGPPPSDLLRNGGKWTQRWRAIHGGAQTGDWATTAAKKLLCGELRSLAYGKCAFCEGVLGVTTYLEIEHYTAKTVDPSLAFHWENLFPICRLCNNAKSDVDHAGDLLRPDVDDPESLLWLNPDNGELQPRASLDAGQLRRIKRTIDLCDLQRGPLCTKRIEMMEATKNWLERVARSGLDDLLRKEWSRLTDPRTEHKFAIRYTFEIRGQTALAAIDRVRFSTP